MRESRIEAICREMKRIQADMVALQEAWSHGRTGVVDHIAERCEYPHRAYRPYPDDPNEGLAFLSKLPIEHVSAIWDTMPARQIAIRAVIVVAHRRVAVTNVHLDWRSILAREDEIVDLDRWLTGCYSPDTYEVLCGDFNAASDSSVHRFLTGKQSLDRRSTLWADVAEYYANRIQGTPAVTLDFDHNPRWAGVANMEIPLRCDWILLKHGFSSPSPMIKTVEVFGTTPSKESGVIPSDHYGVVLNATFLGG